MGDDFTAAAPQFSRGAAGVPRPVRIQRPWRESRLHAAITAMIPHTVEPRADTGVSNVTMGIWLFLASEVMLFGSLFSAYALLRVSAPSWPHGGDVLSQPLGLANTAILFVTSGLALRARLATDAVVARRLLAAA